MWTIPGPEIWRLSAPCPSLHPCYCAVDVQTRHIGYIRDVSAPRLLSTPVDPCLTGSSARSLTARSKRLCLCFVLTRSYWCQLPPLSSADINPGIVFSPALGSSEWFETHEGESGFVFGSRATIGFIFLILIFVVWLQFLSSNDRYLKYLNISTSPKALNDIFTRLGQ